MCVGTPIGDDGTSDLSQLEGALAGHPAPVRAGRHPRHPQHAAGRWHAATVEASGLPTARVFTNPEFLRQGTAVEDFGQPDAGSSSGGSRTPTRPRSMRSWASTTPIDAPRLVVDVEAAEIIKNGANAFLALKLSFTNEIASLCEEAGADVDEVLAGITRRPADRSHLHAAELRLRRQLPAEGAHHARPRRASARPADARHGGRLGRQPRRAGPVRRADRGGRRRRGRPDDRPARPRLQGRHRRHPRFAGHPAGRAPARRGRDRPRLRPGRRATRPRPGVPASTSSTTRASWSSGPMPWSWRPSGRSSATCRGPPGAHAGDRPLVIDGRRLLDAAALRRAGFEVIQLGDGRDQSTAAPVVARSAP